LAAEENPVGVFCPSQKLEQHRGASAEAQVILGSCWSGKGQRKLHGIVVVGKICKEACKLDGDNVAQGGQPASERRAAAAAAAAAEVEARFIHQHGDDGKEAAEQRIINYALEALKQAKHRHITRLVCTTYFAILDASAAAEKLCCHIAAWASRL